MKKKYNFIFSKLVHDENDLVGLIAYALYKQHKIEFIESFKATHGGIDPDDEDLDSFCLSSCTPSSLNSYRDEAQSLLEKLTLEAAKEEISNFQNDMLLNYRQEIENAVKNNKPKWWNSVLCSLIGAAAFSLLIALGSYLGRTSEKENVEIITNTINSLLPQHYDTNQDTILINHE